MTARLLAGAELSRYRHLTYPMFGRLLSDPPPADMVFAGLETGGYPTGLAICRTAASGFEIASLYSLLRPLGQDGRAELLATLMTAMARRGLTRGVFHVTIAAGDQETPALLAALGWRGPRLRNVIARTTTEAMLTLPFARLGGLGPGHAVCAWRDVGAAARETLRERIEALPAELRREIDPFRFEGRAEPDHGAALLAEDEVVAWHLPERLDARQMRWTCSAPLPGRPGTAIMMLWKHVLERQRDAGIPELVWGVSVEHLRMMRFVLKRLRPALNGLSYGVTFDLGAPPEDPGLGAGD